MEPSHLPGVLDHLLLSEEQIQARIAELADEIAEDYRDRPPLLVGVLKGAVMVMADLSRALPISVEGIGTLSVEPIEIWGKNPVVAKLVREGRSDVDLSPMVHVSDVMTLGRRETVEAFYF